MILKYCVHITKINRKLMESKCPRVNQALHITYLHNTREDTSAEQKQVGKVEPKHGLVVLHDAYL
jgi:hypothetical protein